MKRIVSSVILTLLLIVFCSCEKVDEVDRRPIDCYYTESESKIVTQYTHEYSWLRGEWIMVPSYHTETVPETYHILYLITFSDGSTSEEWETVDKETYDAFIKGEG